jgi:2-succinyl-6-hydroxy-2,4-cyclohexadiene-1-carboxylate synthase
VIHVFHGFLGSPQDFSFLPHRDDIKLYDLLDFKSAPIIHPEDTLIGYSMGGRIALELAAKNNFNIKKLILISSHPGLESQDEKSLRAKWEDEVLSRLNTQDSEAFEEYWNNLPIFTYDQPIKVKNLNSYASVFGQFRLSEQKNFLPELSVQTEKLLWIIGERDEKYRKLAEDELLPRGISVRFIDGGHRLFQNSDTLLKVLIEEGIL